jgi:hypothetical protein
LNLEVFFVLLYCSSLSLKELIPEEKLLGSTRTTSVSETSDNGIVPQQPPLKRIQHLSETSDGGSTDSSSNCDVFGDECDVLQEMFPDSSFIEVSSVYVL